MKKLLMLVLILLLYSTAFSIEVIPKYAGSTSADSIRIPIVINDIDTVAVYEAMNLAGSDKIIIYRYGPGNTLITADTNTANIVKLQNGIYEARYRASDGSGTIGLYRVFVMAYFKGKLRGGEGTGYYVIPKGLGTALADLEDANWFHGSILGSRQEWFTSTVGGSTVTDSIEVYDSLDVKKRVIIYDRQSGSAVIIRMRTE